MFFRHVTKATLNLDALTYSHVIIAAESASTLQALSASFTELSTILQPLLAHNYEALNTALQANSSASASTQTDAADKGEDELHGRLDAARMQVSVAYVLMDLVWILLKTKGVDPTNHPVMQELERVKSYFGKIKRVQDDEKEPKEEQKGSGSTRVRRAGSFGPHWLVNQGPRRESTQSSTMTHPLPRPKRSRKRKKQIRRAQRRR